MRRLSTPLAIALVLGLSGAAGAQSQPPEPQSPAPAKVTAQPKKAAPYDESADAKAQIARALARASKEHKRVLLQWGGNWCTWCVALDNLYKTDKDIRKELLYEYELVLVDIGKGEKNQDLAEKYGADLKKNGYPFLTILDASGQPIANQETSALEVKQAKDAEKKVAHEPKAVLDFLTRYQAPAVNAEDVLKSGLSQARNENKLAFVHFGAPWCVFCRKLEDWMARPEIAKVLAKDFVDVKIDVDRTTGGNDVLARFNTKKTDGIPWLVFVDADGKPLADGNGPQGNVGFPTAPEEIAHFASMLRTAHRNLTDADIETLTTSLEDDRKAGQKH